MRAMSTALNQPVDAPAILTEDLLRKFDTPGPRYTSYPTADRFAESFGACRRRRACSARAGAAARRRRSRSTCTSRSANRSATTAPATRSSPSTTSAPPSTSTRWRPRSAWWPSSLGAGRPVSQLHFGGGSPTFLSRRRARARDGRAAAPRSASTPTPRSRSRSTRAPSTPARLAHLRELGFNRISFGVQDFDPEVQQAVHRVQSFERVRELMTSARAARLRLDQRRPDLRPAETDAARASRAPSRRSASCGPTASRSTPTRTCRSASSRSAASPTPTCPSAPQRVAMLGDAIDGFLARGYCYIGMDHFALPRRRARRRQARRPAASQLPGLQHAARLRPGRRSACRRSAASARPTTRTRRRCPSTTTSLGQGQLPVVRGTRADRRRPAAARRDHGADVPGSRRVRGDRTRRTGSACGDYFATELEALRDARATSGLVDARARRDPGDRRGLVRRARGRDGVRPPSAGRQGKARIFSRRLTRQPHVGGARSRPPRMAIQGFRAMVTRALASVIAFTPWVALPARKTSWPASSVTVAASSSMASLPSRQWIVMSPATL